MTRAQARAAAKLARVSAPVHTGARPLKPTEIAIGWPVANDWATALVEPWEHRKARRARERERMAST